MSVILVGNLFHDSADLACMYGNAARDRRSSMAGWLFFVDGLLCIFIAY